MADAWRRKAEAKLRRAGAIVSAEEALRDPEYHEVLHRMVIEGLEKRDARWRKVIDAFHMRPADGEDRPEEFSTAIFLGVPRDRLVVFVSPRRTVILGLKRCASTDARDDSNDPPLAPPATMAFAAFVRELIDAFDMHPVDGGDEFSAAIELCVPHDGSLELNKRADGTAVLGLGRA
jgi:hypothetical protein